MTSNILLILLLTLSLAACTGNSRTTRPVEGPWKGLMLLEGDTIPFMFRVSKTDTVYALTLINGEEEIPTTRLFLRDDSLWAELPAFDSWLQAGMVNDSVMTGEWLLNLKAEKKVVPFQAAANNTNRFERVIGPGFNVTGKWETGFYNPDDTAFRVEKAIAVMEQSGGYVTATFLTPTGDYRYLEGIVDGRNLMLSSFDGARAYLFRATYNNQRLEGEMRSAGGSYRKWIAERNEEAILPDADTLTRLAEDIPVHFSFPDLEGKMVSNRDEKYRNKVLILQVMGSWCPNCLDETEYLAELYDRYHEDGLEIIALAFERSDNHARAAKAISKHREHTGAGYDFLIAGKASKKEASEKLPFLTEVISFPTTVFINRRGEVVRVHTGYNGPATGFYHRKFREETETLLEELLSGR